MRTEIATLGEFGLIDRLTEGIKPENESTKYGVGDDAAVLSYPSEKQLLVTTDLLMEGVHFDLTYVPLKLSLIHICNWHHQNIPQIHTSGSVQMSLSEAPDQRVLISIFRTISPTYCTRHRTGLYHSERIASSGECMPIVSSTNKGIHLSLIHS